MQSFAALSQIPGIGLMGIFEPLKSQGFQDLGAMILAFFICLWLVGGFFEMIEEEFKKKHGIVSEKKEEEE